MKVKLVERRKDELDLGLVYGGIGLLGFLGARYLYPFANLLPGCPFRGMTGIPCPTCGITRSGIFLARFHFIDSFLMNPLVIITGSVVGLWALVSLITIVRGKKFRLILTSRDKNLLRWVITGIIVTNWIYLMFSA